MLVLQRSRGEVICIGDDITLTVVEIRGGKVRLGIVAPQHVPVHRKEVFDAIQAEGESRREKAERNRTCDLTRMEIGGEG